MSSPVSRSLGGRWLILPALFACALILAAGIGSADANAGAGSAPSPQPPLATGTPSATVTSVPSATPTACYYPNPIQNPGFETGQLAPWVVDGFNNPPVVVTHPHSGTYSVLVGSDQGPEPDGDSSLYQQITVPPTGGTLSFWYFPGGAGGPITFDYQDAYVTDTNGNVLAVIMHRADYYYEWTHMTFNMAPFAGQTVRIKFLVHEDGFGDLTFMYVDDVAIDAPDCVTVTPSPAPPTPTPTPNSCGPPGPWTAAAPYPIEIRNYAFAQVGTDFYVISGYSASGGTEVNRYSTVTGLWSPLANIPQGGDGAMAAYYGGKIYAGYGSGFYIYDIATNTWTQGANVPHLGHYWGAAGAYNGKVYFVGGGIGDEVCPNNWPCPSAIIDIYDIATNSWSAGPDAPVGYLRGGFTQAGPFLYLVGSYEGWPWLGNSTTTMRLDMAGGGWSTGPTWTMARSDFGLAFDPASNKLFALGGEISPYLYGNPSAEVDELDVTGWPNGQWVISPPALPSPRQSNSAGFYSPGKIWSTGGAQSATYVLFDHLYRDTGDGPCSTSTPTVTVPTATSPAASTPTNTPPVPTSISTATATPTSLTGATSTPTGTTPPESTATATTCLMQFTDVPTGSTFYPYIRCLACRGVISGYNDNTFHPNNNITRGQISKMVSNAASFEDQIPSDQQTYTDVPPTNTFWLWIERLTLHNVMSGYLCGGAGEPCDQQQRPYFRWAANATRGQLSKIVANADEDQTVIPSTQQTFEDVPSTNTFWLWIERLAQRGVMGGYSCGQAPAGQCVPPENRAYFLPFNNVTRGQASKIVANTFFPNCQTPGNGR